MNFVGKIIISRSENYLDCEEMGHFHPLLCEEIKFPLPSGKK